jgi:hypothetical protein
MTANPVFKDSRTHVGSSAGDDTDIFSIPRQDELSPFDHFGQFALNLDCLGLPDDWSPYMQHFETSGQDDGANSIESEQRVPASDDRLQANHVRVSRCGSPFTAWLPSAPTADESSLRLPDRGMLEHLLSRLRF